MDKPTARSILSVFRHRTLAGLPLALAAILMVSSVAFAATVIRTVAGPAEAAATVDTGSSGAGAGGSGDSTLARQAAATDQSAAQAGAGERAESGPQTGLELTPATASPVPASAEPTGTTEPSNVAAPLEVSGCPASVANLGPLAATDNLDLTLGFRWTAYSGGAFDGYVLAYELTASGKTPSYPVSSTWASPAATATSASVSGVGPGDYQVRLQAIDRAGSRVCVVAQTSTIHVHLSTARFSPGPVVPPSQPPAPTAPALTPAPTPAPGAGSIADLGPLAATANLDFTLGFSWNAYTGGSFAGYRLVYELSASGRTPSLVAGSPTWASPAPGVTSVRVSGVGPGNYQVRVEAIAYLDGAPYVCGRTNVIHVRLSAARVPPSLAPSVAPSLAPNPSPSLAPSVAPATGAGA